MEWRLALAHCVGASPELWESKDLINSEPCKGDLLPTPDIFQNQIQEQKDTSIIHNKDNRISIENYYLTQTRKISLERNKLLIEDWVTQDTIWNFIFAPEIEMIRNKNIFLINKENSTFATLESTLVFKPETGFYSESYGKIKKCVKLVGGNKISKTIYHKILITLKY